MKDRPNTDASAGKEREDAHSSGKARGAFTESMIDETLRESFPASDPPGWCLGTQIGIPRATSFEETDEV